MKIMCIIAVVIIIFGLSAIKKDACNPKGTLASKINWSGNKECK